MPAPSWAKALTQNKTKFLVDALERVQQYFCKILFPFKSYEWTMKKLNLTSLRDRRIILSKKTALKMSKHPKYCDLFVKITQNKTRSTRRFTEPTWKSLRYGYSAIPFFIRLLNGEKA